MINRVDREESKIQTSYLTYDLSILEIENNVERVEKVSKIFNGVKAELKKVAGLMETHCRGYRKLYDSMNSGSCLICKTKSSCIDRCFICTDQIEFRIQEEKNVAQRNSDNHILDLIEKRLKLIETYWNHRIKKRDCHINLLFDGEFSPFFYLFGTSAIGVNLPVSSPFWSSRIRLGLSNHNYVSCIDNFPMHRVKSSYMADSDSTGGKRIFIRENIDVHPNPHKESFVLYAFLQKLPKLNTKSGRRAKYLRELTNYIFGNAQKFDGNQEQASLREDLKKVQVEIDGAAISLFLTYSTSYPFVIKSEFKEMKDLSLFINVLDRAPIIGSFNTIIGYQDAKLFDKDNIDSCCASHSLFQLLVRAKKGTGGLAKDIIDRAEKSFANSNAEFTVTNIIIKNQEGNDINSGWYERPFYWDINIIFRTNAVSKLVDFMLKDINEINGIQKIAVMPIYNIIEQNEDGNDKCETREHALQKQLQDEKKMVKYYEEEWAMGLQDFPAYDYYLDDTIERLCDDHYLIRWNHLRQETRWLISYTGQIKKEWIRQANNSNTDNEDKGVATFKGIIEELSATLQEILRIDQVILKSQEVAEQAKALNYLLQLHLWKKLTDLSIEINRIKTYLISIRSEFNTKIEAQQMVNLTGPLRTAGDPAGVTDLTIEAARRLFKHYCSRPSKDTKVWGDKAAANSKREWNGIVSTTNAKDFQLVMPLQLLYLPIDMKFKTQGKFLILAHEAAHQILSWIEKTKHPKKQSAGGDISAWVSFEEEVWGELSMLIDGWVEIRKKKKKEGDRIDDIAAITQIVGKRRKLTRKFYSLEFLCDIFALLCAGPGYIRPLFEMVYLPRKVDTISSGGKAVHPPMWLRITILLYICHNMGWIKLFGDEKEVNEYNSRFDTFKIYNLAKHHFQKYERWGDRSLWDYLRDVESLIDCLDPAIEWIYEVAVLGALAQEKSIAFLYKLIAWTEKHSNNFLYYPLAGINTNSKFEEIENAWSNYNGNTQIIDQYVKFLSERMIYNNEIILEAPLKYISAAMCLPEVSHPQYSTGKIMHSLCYAHDLSYVKVLEKNW